MRASISFFQVHTKLCRQFGGADAPGMAGFLLLMIGVPALLFVLCGGGLFWAVTKEPEPTLTQRMAKEQLGKDLIGERLALEAQLPADLSSVVCRPTNDQLQLSCVVRKTGLLSSEQYLKFSAVPGVPVVGFAYDAREAESTKALYVDGALTHRQRMALFHAFPRVK